MDTTHIIERFKKELPDFIWEHNPGNNYATGYYFVNNLSIYEGGRAFMECTPPILCKSLLSVADKYPSIGKSTLNKIFNDPDWDGVLILENDTDIDFYIEGLRVWMAKCDALRKSNVNQEQIVFVHADCDRVPCMIKDLSHYIESDDIFLWRGIGIMNKCDWNFTQKLNDTFCESTGDSFYFSKDEEIDEEEQELLDKLYKEYPAARKIKTYIFTDYD